MLRFLDKMGYLVAGATETCYNNGMECAQCGKLAVIRISGDDGTVHLCLDCNLKYEQAQSIEFDRLTRHHNMLVSQMEATMGLSAVLPRYAPVERPVFHLGDVTLNNINVDRSAIGVLNTGTIGTVDGAVTVLKEHGEAEAGDAIARLTEAVINEAQMSVEKKQEALEMLSLLSTEATTPKDRRRSFAMKPLLLELSTVLGGVSAVAGLWQKFGPMIIGLFQ